MESYIATTEAFLGLLQSAMSEEEFERSASAAEEMYEQFRLIAEKNELNIREMLNAILSINCGTMELMKEQLEQLKE